MDRLPPELAAAGAVRRRTSVPDPITLDWLVERCSMLERVMRLQFPGDEFPPEHREALAVIGPPDRMERALSRYTYLRGLHRMWDEGRLTGEAAASASPRDDGIRAMDQLLRREPVVVQLQGRRVEITGRSYSAMYEMAAHGLAADRALHEADRARELYEQTRAALRGGLRHRIHLLRRMRRLERLHRAAYTEAEHHRRAFYAHALTDDGAPASDPSDAPDWWREMGPNEHAALVAALFQAGPERGRRLPKPRPRKESDREPGDDFGGLALLNAWGVRTGVEPASTLTRDYGQQMAELRAHSETQAVSARDEVEYL